MRSWPGQGGGKLSSVEAARGVAALLVVLYHAARHLDKNIAFGAGRQWTQFGHAGVDFFFVISGFIIFFVHARDVGCPDRLGHYLWRRATRIFPAYWGILALTILPLLLPGRDGLDGWDFFLAVSLLPTAADPLVGVAWTLQHEMAFYGLFALLILHRSLGIAAFLLWLALIGVNLHVALPVPRLLSAYNLEFCLGMAVAYAARRLPAGLGGWAFAAGLAAFVFFAGAEVAGRLDGYGPLARLAYGVPSGLIILGLAVIERQRPIRLAPPVLWLGRASYSIYLFHLLSLGIFYKLWMALGLMERLPPAACFAGLVVAGLAGGMAASRLIEYPAMHLVRQWGRRLGSQQSRSPAA